MPPALPAPGKQDLWDKVSRSWENRGAAPRQGQRVTISESFFSSSESGPHKSA